MIRIKELEPILSSYNCNKNCPYCTAKITKWQSCDDKLDEMESLIEQITNNNYTFDFFTISGNGEPCLYSDDDFEKVINAGKKANADCFRILTSGIVFSKSQNKKLSLLLENNYKIEVTRVAFDSREDMKIMEYNFNYMNTDLFKNNQKNIRLNIVLTNNVKNNIYGEIQKYLEAFPEIDTICLKTLNKNTLNDDYDNKYSKWIEVNAMRYSEMDDIISMLIEKLGVSPVYDDIQDSYIFYFGKNKIYISAKKKKQQIADFLIYGGKITDYKLNQRDLLRKKVYIGGKFNKEYIDGNLSLKNDFRTALLKDESKLKHHNTNSVVGNYIYAGPFYEEKASCGELTSIDCKEIVKAELDSIASADVFIAYLTKDISVGTISEVIHASYLNKDIFLLYDVEDTEYSHKTEYWFSIETAKYIIKDNSKIHLIPINNYHELLKETKKIIHC